MNKNTLLKMNASLMDNPTMANPFIKQMIYAHQQLVASSLHPFSTPDGSIPSRAMDYFETLCAYQDLAVMAKAH